MANWDFLVVQNTVTAIIIVMRQQMNFANLKWNNILVGLQTFFMLVIVRKAFHGIPDWSTYFNARW